MMSTEFYGAFEPECRFSSSSDWSLTLIQGAKSIEEIRRSITTVPWNNLAHAYHGAWEAPEKLKVFLAPDSSEESLDKAVDWLWGSILHQGSIYSASIPVLWILIDLIATKPEHPAAASILYAVQTIANSLLSVDADEDLLNPVQQNAPGQPVYEAWTHKALPTSVDDASEDDEYFKACLVTQRPLRALVQHAIPVISYCLQHPKNQTRTAAVAAGLGAVQAVPDDAQPLFELIKVIGDASYDPGTWISVAMVFGQLGHDITELLNHSDRRVRLSAALSKATQNNPQSITELAAAIAEPEWLEEAFPNGAAHLAMHLRFHVLSALLDRTNPDVVHPSITAAICTLIHKRSSQYTVDVEWGRVLHWAFQKRLIKLSHTGETAPLPDRLTSTQAAILRTLCAKDELWNPTNGNAHLAYRRVQLPYDRQVLCSLVNLVR